MISTNNIGEDICRNSPELKPSFLDSNNILWKVVDEKWIGKRSVFTKDFRACWLEDIKNETVNSWWCGENADYKEIFTK